MTADVSIQLSCPHKDNRVYAECIGQECPIDYINCRQYVKNFTQKTQTILEKMMRRQD